MADLLHEPLLEMLADKPFWSVFAAAGDGGERDEPSPEMRAAWLTNFLILWARNVDGILDRPVDPNRESTDEGTLFPGSSRPIVQLLLLSLDNAAEGLLAFKKRDHPVQVPDSFLDTASHLLAVAEEREICPENLTIRQIAMRLAAATSSLRTGPRQVKINEHGHVFDLARGRLFQFDPTRVLQGKRQAAAGDTFSLRDLREAEERTGR